MQRDVGVSASLITAINGLIVVFTVSSQIFQKRLRTRRATTHLDHDAEKPQAPLGQKI
jgi:hypothetical protein